MNKKRTITLLIVLVMLAILLFLAHTVRNFIIIKGLEENIEKYVSSTNYHVKRMNMSLNEIQLLNYYEKDEKQLVIRELELNGERTKLSMYNNGNAKNAYYETATGKTATLNANDSTINIDIKNYLETENVGQTLVNSIKARIKEVTYAGKECYEIDNLYEQLFIEKDTGLLRGICGEGSVIMIDYSFNKVKDEIFNEPNIEEYLVMDMKANT